MKKIILLILATLTLASCGVNSLNPEKLELQKKPIYGAPVITDENYSLADFLDAGATYNQGVSGGSSTTITGIPLDFFTPGSQIPTTAEIQIGMVRQTCNISVSEGTTPQVYDIEFGIDPSSVIADVLIAGTKKAYVPFDASLLAITAPSKTGTLTDQTDLITVPGYTYTAATGSAPEYASQTAVYAYTDTKGSEIFDALDDTIKIINTGADKGKFPVPTAATATVEVGSKYKLWFLETYKAK